MSGEIEKVHSFDDYSVTLSVYLPMNDRAYSLSVPASLHAFGGPDKVKYNKNLDATADGDSCIGCVLCGKKTNSRYLVDGGFFVMLSNVGEYITAEEYNDMDDLGLYPIGSDCLKKLKLKPFGVPIYDGKGKKVSK